jgi:hypothetical protein
MALGRIAGLKMLAMSRRRGIESMKRGLRRSMRSVRVVLELESTAWMMRDGNIVTTISIAWKENGV